MEVRAKAEPTQDELELLSPFCILFLPEPSSPLRRFVCQAETIGELS